VERVGRFGCELASLRAAHAGRLRLPDAFVLVTAIELGADLVLTADRRSPRRRFLDPNVILPARVPG
jgi:hypothetical protein